MVVVAFSFLIVAVFVLLLAGIERCFFFHACAAPAIKLMRCCFGSAWAVPIEVH